MGRCIYPDEDMKRWEIYNNCCEMLANADNYYTIYQIDKLLKDKASSESVAELSQQVNEILGNTYTKDEINAILENYLDISALQGVMDNYAKIDGTTLVLNE